MKLPRFVPALCLAAGFALTAPLHAIWRTYDEAEVVLGRTSLPTPLALHMPYDIAVSPVTGHVFVVDYGNNRVLRYPTLAQAASGQPAEAVFGQPDLYSGDSGLSQSTLYGPQAVAVDAAGNLWVSDTENNRVLRWSNATTAASGSPAAQVLGQAGFTTRGGSQGASGLSRPGGLAVDAQGRLWIADYFNNRVLRYENPTSKGNAGAADGVIGQADFNSNVSGTTATTFSSPYDLDVDAGGRLWVADFGNARILRWDNAAAAANGDPANGVLAQPNFTSNSTGVGAAITNRVITLEVTDGGSLYAMDTQNSRVLRWDNAAAAANGAAANGVLGRTGFLQNSPYSSTPGSIGSGTRGMTSSGGTLWVADRDTERVLRWDNAASKANGGAADGVIGEASTSSSYKDTNPAQIARVPKTGLEDPATGKFFVADDGRVLRYASRPAAETGSAPEAVLGKATAAEWGYTTGSQVVLSSAWGLAMDSAGKLWVSDRYANRVVAFPNAATAPTGSPMSVVLGQANFTDENEAATATGMSQPTSVAIDTTGHLYVADTGNNRVLRFDAIATQTSSAPANGVIGQLDLEGSSTPPGISVLSEPSGLTCDAQGRLWVADTGKNRVLRYNTPVTMAPLDPPSGSLGGSANVSASGMSHPGSVAVDAGGRLFVMDTTFNRILLFDSAATKANGANADRVLGEPDFTSYVLLGRSRRLFERPTNLFTDVAGNVWVADEANLRLMRFSPESSAVIIQSGVAGANYSLTFQGVAGVTYTVTSSTDLKKWDAETSYPFAVPGTQVFTEAMAGPKRFYRVEEP